ncbi:MAG: hypothetical protein AAFY26_00365 [Cyanobacteria bacterium J06638_22]
MFNDTFNLTRGLKVISLVTDSDTIPIAEDRIPFKTTVLNITRPDISSKSGHVALIESPERVTKQARTVFDFLRTGLGKSVVYGDRSQAIAINHGRSPSPATVAEATYEVRDV